MTCFPVPPKTVYSSPSRLAPAMAGPSPDITFVLHDAGETKAMQPVMARLDRDGIPYCILAEATARLLLQNNPHLMPQLSPDNTTGTNGSDAFISSKHFSNNLSPGAPPPLSEGQNRLYLQRLQSSRCVITGLVSDFQKNWASFFKRAKEPVIGYYDGFNYSPSDQVAENFAGKVDAVLTPSQDSAVFFRERFAQAGAPNLPVQAVGQPVLETAAQVMRSTNPAELASALGIDPQKPTLVFVGGKGPNYTDAFRLFCAACRQLPAGSANVLVSLHPQMNGAEERQILQETQMQDRISIVPKSIDTAQLLALSPTVLAQDSTFIMQAYLLGRPVAYLGNPVQNTAVAFNPLTAKMLVPRFQQPDLLAQFIRQNSQANSATTASEPASVPASGKPMPNLPGLYEALGIPQQATERLTNYLKSFLPIQAVGMPDPPLKSERPASA
jgi:hypothetical protein